MKLEEAIRRCEFWTTALNSAWGTTSDPEVGEYFDGREFPWEWSKPTGKRGWAIQVVKEVQDGPFTIQNIAYKLILQEIERRAQDRVQAP